MGGSNAALFFARAPPKKFFKKILDKIK